MRADRLRNLLLALAVAAAPAVAEAQALAGMAPRALAYSQAYGGDPASTVIDIAGGDAQRTVALPKGKSAIVELPVDARDVLVSNPAVADAVLRHPRRIYIVAVANGQTDAVFFDAAGRRILSLDIRVGMDASGLGDIIARLVPGSRIRAEAVNDSVVLSGEAPSAIAADQAVRLAQSYVAKPEQVVNMMTIAGKDQVMLKVRIVEVQRTVIKQLGFNMSAVLNRMGEPQYLLSNSASFGVNGGLLGGLAGGYKLDTTSQGILAPPADCEKVTTVDASNLGNCVGVGRIGSAGLNQAESTVQAFERVGLIRTLAEPNLTALSGESAKFLAGGEYPIPVSQDNTGAISVEFKPFGVGLGFTPVVLSEGRISVKLSTEVSELTTNGAFTVGAGQAGSLTIPALNVRRAETTVELPSGGSMMIAGLLQEATRQNLDSLPGMMNLPVLGSLFRSRDFQKGETELVVIVTPYLVKSVSGRLQTPADGLRIAHDMETTLLGKLNKTNGVKPGAVQGRTYQGPYGYVIE